jgi:hypothetical protein
MKKYYLQAIALGDRRSAELLGKYYLEIDNIELGVDYYVQSVDIASPENMHYLYKKFKYHKECLLEFHKNIALRFKKLEFLKYENERLTEKVNSLNLTI